MTYDHLHQLVWHPPLAFEERTPPAGPQEIELQALWFAGAFGRDFRTTGGLPVRIVQFGEWNRGAGPDFFQCAVEISGETLTGPVELDPRAADWEHHGHGRDPAFRDVILHVTFTGEARNGFTRNCDNREIPRVIVSRQQLDEALNRPPREVAIAHPGRCVFPLKGLTAGALESLMEEAASHRAARKSARWVRTEDAHGRDSALFLATAETLGYGGNSLAMRILAQRLPLATLRSRPDEAEALLFGAAGFLDPRIHGMAPPDTRDYLRDLWEKWWHARGDFEPAPERRISWRMSGQRPAHHPHRRVAALAALVAAWPQYRRLALARPFKAKPLLDFLGALKHPLWSHRHTLTSPESRFGLALFGRVQGLELLANHLVPLALREDGFRMADYLKLRHSVPNRKVKRCAIRLFGSEKSASPWLRRVAHHQALLQIYHDFCLEDFSGCDECPFPEQLAQWK